MWANSGSCDLEFDLALSGPGRFDVRARAQRSATARFLEVVDPVGVTIEAICVGDERVLFEPAPAAEFATTVLDFEIEPGLAVMVVGTIDDGRERLHATLRATPRRPTWGAP